MRINQINSMIVGLAKRASEFCSKLIESFTIDVKDVYEDVQSDDYDYLVNERPYSPFPHEGIEDAGKEKEPWRLKWIPPSHLRLSKYDYSKRN